MHSRPDEMAGWDTVSLLYRRISISLGISMTVAAIISLLAGGGGMSQNHAVFIYAVLSVIVLCKAAGWHVGFPVLQHLYSVYRVVILLLAVVFLFIICLHATGNVYASLLILYCLIWFGKPARKHSGLNIVFGGWIFLRSSSVLYQGMDESVVLMFCLFSVGGVIILHMLQKEEKMETGRQKITPAEIIETGVVLSACLIAPVCAALAVSLPFETAFLSLREEYAHFEQTIPDQTGPDAELFFYIGVVIVMSFILFWIWKKIAEREAEDQIPIEEGPILFGKRRPLRLENRKPGRFGTSYRGKIIELYYKFIRITASRGANKEPYQTPEEFLQVIREHSAGALEAAGVLTRLFIIARFSNHSVGKEEYRECRHVFDTARNSIAADAEADLLRI